jgi:hypothetical protein
LNYKEGVEKLYEIASGAIKEAGKIRKVFVGHTENNEMTVLSIGSIYDEYPGICKIIKSLDKKIVFFKREQEKAPEKSKQIFWSLFNLLINEILTTRCIMELPKNGFSKEINEIFKILEDLDDKNTVITEIALQVKKAWRNRSEIETVTEVAAERGLELLKQEVLINLQTP